MITVAQKEYIRREHYIEGKSIRRIQRETGHSRKTIRKAIRDSSIPQYRRTKPPPCPILDSYKDLIDQILVTDKTAPRKQRHTARRIFVRLHDEHQFKGSESSVRRYVQFRKKEIGIGKEVFVPINHKGICEADVDWGTAIVNIAGEDERVNLFELRMCDSGASFLRAFPTVKQEAFFEGHRRAFDFLDGVVPKINYDNLKAAVKKILIGKNRQEQDQFIAFRSHYLFNSHFCNPGCAHEKGGVENFVGYSRRNFLVPVPKVSSYEELNNYLLECCRKEWARIAQGETKSIGELFQQEKRGLLALPPYPFECCQIKEVRVNHLSQVTFETNKYSVPVRYAYQKLTLKAYVDQVLIAYQDKVIATHCRAYQKNCQISDPTHYLPLAARKPAILDVGLPFKDWSLVGAIKRCKGILSGIGAKGMEIYHKVLNEVSKGKTDSLDEVLSEGYCPGDSVGEQKRWQKPLGILVPSTGQYNRLLAREEDLNGDKTTSKELSEAAAAANHTEGF